MTKKMRKGFPFPAEGVYITLHKEYDKYKVKKKPKVDSPPKEAKDIVINFEIHDQNDKKITSLGEPFELRVDFKKKHEDDAGGAENLELKFDKMDGTGWHTFDNLVLVHNGKGKGGVGIVLSTEWDPMVGWFP